MITNTHAYALSGPVVLLSDRPVNFVDCATSISDLIWSPRRLLLAIVEAFVFDTIDTKANIVLLQLVDITMR